MKKISYKVIALYFTIGASACSPTEEIQNTSPQNMVLYPADQFDLSHWSITIPVDEDKNGVADKIDPLQLQTYFHPDYFYLDEKSRMVFTSPNRAFTSPTSTNTRSELGYEFRGLDASIASKDPRNNWALSSHKNADKFASIGGKMEATLQVDHVSTNAGYPNKEPAFSVVVGQIHAAKLDSHDGGFGWGNEPLKISYKKWPNHKNGSIFWAYERNLSVDDPNRTDIEHTVWGNSWTSDLDPGTNGIALGEEFSYTVNVVENTMYLTFEADGHPTVKHQINLSNNMDANGIEDALDHPQGYSGDSLYFKAGAYNQCSTKDAPTFRYPACPGTGDLATDLKDGNYTRVSFSKLVVSDPAPE